ncbi:hypothetical protein AWZ03_005249 [Drosophila navojoa]|uniref:Small EDRK-rich factor-like N-terminal domain-containing protein n=1 Tax=Drosophila navojoa TaxID=7232 RepID=A0A484BHZ2_DRONA|nr:hypothetical protein AWZ03_005249 [Drosophila navojoa]
MSAAVLAAQLALVTLAHSHIDERATLDEVKRKQAKGKGQRAEGRGQQEWSGKETKETLQEKANEKKQQSKKYEQQQEQQQQQQE